MLNVAGILSGTSVDSISYAICRIGHDRSKPWSIANGVPIIPDLSVEVQWSGSKVWPPSVRLLLLALADPSFTIPHNALHIDPCIATGGNQEQYGDWETGALKRVELRAQAALQGLFPSDGRHDAEIRRDRPQREQPKDLQRDAVMSAMAMSEANFLVAECFAAALKSAEKEWKLLPLQKGKVVPEGMDEETWKRGERRIDLVGSHGQTVWHHQSNLAHKDSKTRMKISSTLQIGDASLISARLEATEVEMAMEKSLKQKNASSINPQDHFPSLLPYQGSHYSYANSPTVVSDFRTMDVSVGGQGAPLTSSLDCILLSASNRHHHQQSQQQHTNQVQGQEEDEGKGEITWTALQNLGGMGNVTLIPHQRPSHRHHRHQQQQQQQQQQHHQEPKDQEEAKVSDQSSTSLSSLLVPFAFDTGPGNVLLDWYANKMVPGCSYDDGGAMGARGKSNPLLLRHFLSHPYFSLPCPKTCGREVFTTKLGEQWWKDSQEQKERWCGNSTTSSTSSSTSTSSSSDPISPEDFQATLTDLTASSLILSYLRFIHLKVADVGTADSGEERDPSEEKKKAPSSSPSPSSSLFPSQIFIHGGGHHNTFLMQRIQYYADLAWRGLLGDLEEHVFGDNHASQAILSSSTLAGNASSLPSPSSSPSSFPSPSSPTVLSHSALGIDPDAKESVLFALLAYLCIHAIPSNIPSCTGASSHAILGKITPGKNFLSLLSFCLTRPSKPL